MRKGVPESHSFGKGNEASPSIAVGRLDLIISAIVAAFSFLIYIQTMSKSIPYIDGGELTTDLWTLGIAHPTGYPLYTMLGYLFVHIPILPEVAMRANLFAALCTSIAAGLAYLVFFRAQIVMAPWDTKRAQKSGHGKDTQTARVPTGEGQNIIRWSSLIAAFTLVFSMTFWEESTRVESYSLQLILFSLIMFTWLGLYAIPAKSRAFIAGLALGLGFTNHMTTILTLPALIFLAILKYRTARFNPKLILYTVCGGLLAGLLYIYLPIRASQHPLMDWGNPDTLKRFIWQVTGKQFNTWMFSSFAVFKHQFWVFFSSLYAEYRISLALVIVGMIVSFAYYRKLFWWTIFFIIGDLIYATNYSIHNISSYFLLTYISLALFSAAGFRFVLQRFVPQKRLTAVALAALLIFPGISAAMNFSKVDSHDDFTVEMYTRDILTSVPHNSVILSFQWDDWVSGSLYYQHVDDVRPDVIVIDKELLRRSWYAAQVHQRYPFLFPAVDPIYIAYRDNLRLFENGLPYDPNSIQHTYAEYIREIISGALRDGRQVFVGPEIENKYLYGYDKVPYGLLYELTKDTTYVPFGSGGLNGFRAAQKIHNDYTQQILGFYTRMFIARARYEYSFEHPHRTLAWLRKTLEVDPSLQAVQTAETQIMEQIRKK